MKKLEIIVFTLGVLILASLFSWSVGRMIQKREQMAVRKDTVTVIKIKEVHDTLPQLQTETIIKYVTIKGKNDTVFVGNDNVQVDSLCDGSVTLPVVQRVYTDDSTYTAYVSGIRMQGYPSLDSIAVRQRILERTITNTITKKRHWHLGVGIGAGVSIITGKPDMTAGVWGGFTF